MQEVVARRQNPSRMERRQDRRQYQCPSGRRYKPTYGPAGRVPEKAYEKVL